MNINVDFQCHEMDLDDLAILIDLEAAAFGPASWGGEGVRTALISPDTQAILISDAGHTTSHGFVIWRLAGGEAEILSIGVTPSMQRKGMATLLLASVIDDLSRNGADALYLEVDGSNSAAIALYKREGFEVVGARKAYYRNGADALIMRHTLKVPC